LDSFDAVFLFYSRYDAIHEALVEKAKSFSGRLIGRPIQASRDNKGLFFKQYDDLWKKWRNFSREGLHSIWKSNTSPAV